MSAYDFSGPGSFLDQMSRVIVPREDLRVRLPGGRTIHVPIRELGRLTEGPEQIVAFLEKFAQQSALSASEHESLRSQLLEMTEHVKKLQEAPSRVAIVTGVDGERVSLITAGQRVEVALPKGIAVTVGATVLVTVDTMQILRVASNGELGGPVLTISRVTGSLAEVDAGGMRRALILPFSAKVGDRVVTDDSATIALKNLGPDPSSNVVSESTGVTWDDIGGLETAKRLMREAIEGPFRDSEIFKRWGKKPTRGILLSGPPGCGKTMLGKAAATALSSMHSGDGSGFFYVKGPEVLNSYVGQSEANVRKLFDDARRHKARHGFPAVIFLDEADAILGTRSGGRTLGMERTIVPQFLAEMDGIGESGAIVIIATNRPDTLDPAIVRDGRIDRRIGVTRPTLEDATAIAEKLLKPTPREGSSKKLAVNLADAYFSTGLVVARVVDLAGVATEITLGDGVCGAAIAGVVERAKSHAMREGKKGVDLESVEAAVRETFEESLNVSHEEVIREKCGNGPFHSIEKGRVEA